MKSRIFVLASVLFIMLLGLVTDSRADISNAAVLFLRIAPGSRAAGMGEAYVAISDDATATHWNPAGLGQAPLSDNWIDASLPNNLRPIKAIAPMKSGNAPNYLAYDVWALTGGGLVRYDNRNWQTNEVFSTRTDETVAHKVQGYFTVNDDDMLARMVQRVVAANSDRSLDFVQHLKDSILSLVPEDDADYKQLSDDFDSLVACYSLCRINWNRFGEIEEKLADAMKDSTLSETEITRISVAVERSRSRFIPEELKIPYNAIFESPATSIASNEDALLVGSSEGLAWYNGHRWQFVTPDDGLPSYNVTCMTSIGTNTIVIGTDSGTAVFNGLKVSRLTTPERTLPSGSIEAIGGRSLNDLYAVVGGDLYHFNGEKWSNSVTYTAVLNDSLTSIANKFALYGTASERRTFLDKYNRIQALKPAPAQTPTPTPEPSADSATTQEPDSASIGMMENSTVNPKDPSSDDVTPAPPDSMTTPETTTTMEPEAPPNEMTTMGQETAASGMPPTMRNIPGIDTPLQAGQHVDVPYLAGIKGRTNAIFVDDTGTLWLGTEYGLFSFDGSGWNAPGYATYTVTEGQTFDEIVDQGAKKLGNDPERTYADFIATVNDLPEGLPTLEAGETIRVYANALASPIRSIDKTREQVFFATARGLVQRVDGSWERADLRGLGEASMEAVNTTGGETWLASKDRLVTRSRGRSEITFMHVNWLPELANDLYYDFLSFVTQKEGWGTFGGNISFISYGKFQRTDAIGNDQGQFESFDFALTLSYGTPLTAKLSGGVSAKLIYSRLSDQGVAAEKGKGTSTGFAVDLGLMYKVSPRLQFGMAVTNIGPKMAYIDAAQSDDLPRNLAVGFAYKLVRSDYNQLLMTFEVNKLLVGLNDGFSTELKQTVLNGGVEYVYNDLLSARAGYIYDQEGDIKTPTVGIGLHLFETFKFDFSYIPSQSGLALANTLRISLGVIL